eukprot:181826-Rhodomonas_salina.1
MEEKGGFARSVGEVQFANKAGSSIAARIAVGRVYVSMAESAFFAEIVGVSILQAPEVQVQLQGMRRQADLIAWQKQTRVQRMRLERNLQTQQQETLLQGVRWLEICQHCRQKGAGTVEDLVSVFTEG